MPVISTVVLSVSLLTNGTISVTPQGQRARTLSWSPPTSRRNDDAMSLDEIGGYEIEYGGPTYPYSIKTNNPKITTLTVYGLDAGVNHFRIRTFDIDGQHSAWSTPVTRNIESKLKD